MQCRSNFYGNTKWWNNHIAIPLTPKEKELAARSGVQHVQRKTPRERRWATFKNRQRSESNLINKLHGLAEHAGGKQLVIAYGSWGMVAGRPGAAVNKHLPPTMGVGMMWLLAKHFPVVITPEAYTSKTCFQCDGVGAEDPLRCAVAPEMVHEVKDWFGEVTKTREIRGLRVCNNGNCRTNFLNRDRNASLNIGKRAWLLVRGRTAPNLTTACERMQQDPHLNLLCDICAPEEG